MGLELWQVALAAVPFVAGLGAALPKLLMVRPQNRKTDAETLAHAYGHVIDRLEAEVQRQGQELVGLREHVTELLKMIGAKDQEIAVLRAELDHERTVAIELRERIDTLEAKVGRRRTDPPTV